MRAALLSLLVLAVAGCNQVEPNQTSSLDDHTKPAPSSTGPARPATMPAANEPGARAEQVRADNTAVNQRDRDETAKTPLDQGENEADRKATADIRQRIVNAENMSINARNVKIITAGGKVTLRGPVNSVAERESIVRFAREVAGETNVEDQLEVASSNP